VLASECVQERLQLVIDVAAVANESARLSGPQQQHVKLSEQLQLFADEGRKPKGTYGQDHARLVFESGMGEPAFCKVVKRRMSPEFAQLGMQSTPDPLLVLNRACGRQGTVVAEMELHVLDASPARLDSAAASFGID
jgi:hypothetical protein